MSRRKRNWFLGSVVALAAVLAFLAVARAQTDHSAAAKSNATGAELVPFWTTMFTLPGWTSYGT